MSVPPLKWGSTMQATRQDILDYLHRMHTARVKDLAEEFRLTPTGVRQHLAVLERDGLVASREERGKVGRPAHVYALTEKGEGRYPKGYDMLANLLMDEVRSVAGTDALQRILRRVSDRMAGQYKDRTEGKTLAERVEVAGEILRENGCVVSCEERGGEFFINQCTCPYPSIARRNTAVCALEVNFVRRVTGGDAHLVATVLRGDPACVYRVRPAAEKPAPAPAPSPASKQNTSG